MKRTMQAIDLNADLGESYGNFSVGRDAELIPLLTSAHLACGFHGGDPRVMDRTVRVCKSAGVAVGAHPSFPDLVGFGRRVLEATGEEIETDVLYQVAALDGFCRRHGVTLQHVKPHGALYNHANRTPEVAEAIAAAIASYDGRLLLVCQSGTELARAGIAAGLTVAFEGFVDRAYNPYGAPGSRRRQGSVHQQPGRAIGEGLGKVTQSTVVAVDGTVVDVEVDTLCAHGDNPEAVEFIAALRDRLAQAGIALKPMREVVAMRAGHA